MKNKVVKSKKLQAIETKMKIFETAKQLIKEHGFEKVSVDSIVEAAGVAKGSFYVHFDSKDTLAAALIDEYVKQADFDYKSYMTTLQKQMPASVTLVSLVGRIADVIACTIGCDNMRALYKAHLSRTIDTGAAINYNRELYEIFRTVISDGMQRREFKRELPVDILAKHFVMAIRGLTFEWCIYFPEFDLKEQSLQHFEILLNGLKEHER